MRPVTRIHCNSASWLILLAALTACDAGRPPAPPTPTAPPSQRDKPSGPASKPAEPDTPGSGAAGASGGAQPGKPVGATSGAGAPQPTSAPSTQPADREPLPDFIEVIERFNDTQPSRTQAWPTPPSRLVIDTENVKRMRIHREKLKLVRDRSIALFLDQQGIEWTTRVETLELERSPTGAWRAVETGRAR